ncbi:MAG: FtsK/SpoIIIE domain-containing protein, partial [Acutalibacteraceae bacterium]
GDICLDVIGGNRNSNAVIESVEKQAQKFGTRTENGYTVRIPYCQSVKDGILLNVCYSSDDAIDAQSLLQQLLLKMFMSLPAGKLEVTMIDPTYSGKYFSDICNLSTSTETTHIIDTNVWTRENDIGTAILTLRQRMEETVQAYGDHKDIILEDEPVRMLAITDFPNGFDNTSLRDLNTILNAGAFAFIFGAKDKIQEFKEQNPSLASLADDILKQTVEVSLENGRLMFSSDPSNRLYLEPDLMEGLTGRTKDNILTQLQNAISKYTPPSVSFSELFDFDIYDSNNWRQGAIDEFCVPIGKKGRSVFNMVLGRSKGAVQHHALVSGTTGAGKSTFLHTLILSTMISYSPEDVQMYLIDFKEGDEFAIYAKYRLPSLKVISLKSEREFGIRILQELKNEYSSRIEKFKEVKGANIYDIEGYEQECKNRPHMEKTPRLLVIFDEVQALFTDAGNNQEAIQCINALSSQGRAAGIYLVLASQTFNGCNAIDFSQFSIRIAIKGTTDSAAKVLNPDNIGIQSLQNRPIGTAIYNTQAGDSKGNNTIKVAIADDTEKHTSEKQRIVEKLHDFYTKDSTGRYSDMQTRVYLANAQDDVNHFINKMICNNGVKHSVRNPDEYKVMLGLDYLKIGPFSIEFGKQNNDNMLIVGADEKKAISIFEMTALSALYYGQQNARVYIIDFSNDTFLQYACKLSDLGELFGDQISIAAGITKAQEMIDKIHSAMNRCEQQKKQCKQRIFFMFFGAQKQLVPNTIYGNPYTDKLKEIFSKGPQYGINSIVWGDSLIGSERLLGDNCEYMFSKRVAYGLNDNDMLRLVGENNSSQLGEHTAVYKDASTTNNTHFRPYDIPSRNLISDFSKAYNKFVN